MLLTNFFGRKKQEYPAPSRASGHLQSATSQNISSVATVSLIDLSPPGSPTFTTRSSSDGVSVDSFGSDGNSNPSAFTSSGSTSQTESAFEDDFDFFGMSTKKITQNDPWQVKTAQDPFGPLEDPCSNVSPSTGETCLFSLNSNNRATQVPSNQTIIKPLITSMPTIIRARPPKPPAPKMLLNKLEPMAKQTYTDSKVSNNSTVYMNKPLTIDFSNTWPNDQPGEDSPSPPMPTIPPPAPPMDYLNSELRVCIKACDYITFIYII